MLTNIQSIYFYKIIFSYISERLKLKMIAHNKNLQGIMNINLFNYKTFSGKYFIGEKNGKRKLYKLSTNILLYEGIYKNGKKMEKGKNIMILVI